jgi:hypothetical protein
MWLFNVLKLRKKRRKNSRIENSSPNILEPTVLKFIQSREEELLKEMDVLLEIYSDGEKLHPTLSFKSAWKKMDRVDKIETLVSMEKEIMGYRKELCQELLDMSKGKW